MTTHAALDEWIDTHLFDTVPQAISVIDRTYRICKTNRRFTEIFGIWQDRNCYDVLKGGSARCKGCQAASVFVDGQVRTTDEVWLDKDRRRRHYVVRLVPIPGDDGGVEFIMNMSTDVTESTKLEREHQILFERAPCLVAVLDRELHIVRGNRSLRETFGSHVGQPCHEVFLNQAERCPSCPALRSFDDGRVHTEELVGVRRDGTPAHYIVTTSPLARAGEPSEYVIEILHDVTDVVDLTLKLERERQFLRSLVDHSIDGIVATEADGSVAILNPAAEALLEVTRSQLEGNYDLGRVYPKQFLNTLISNGTSCILPETTITVGDTEIPIRFSGVVLRERGRVLGSAAFLQDLREVKRLELEKLDAERLAAVGQTVAGLAHGVKNILTGLEGGMFLLRWGLEDDRRDKLQEGWEMLDRNFHKITTFVREFLSFAKGRVPVVAATDPNALVEEVVSLFAEAARAKGVTIETQLQPHIAPANLDAEGLQKCLANLVSNAIDACLVSDRDAGRIVIVRSRDHDEVLEFEVEDNGCGMDYEIKRKIFTSFFTTKGTEGTGIGLLVTKKTVQEHGGFMSIESSPGVGSVFRITLPRKRLPEPHEGESSDADGDHATDRLEDTNEIPIGGPRS
jgi:PAS domain S-box-containing protein